MEETGRINNVISYLNTDLDLTSAQDLRALVAAFEAGGVFPLYGTRPDEDDQWDVRLETDEQYTTPEDNIAAMLSVVEGFDKPIRAIWTSCTKREFNIGYDCGAEPWAFNQGLSAELVRRMGAAGASLRLTMYPDRPTDEPSQQAPCAQ